jgi:HNH endonuclease
MHARDAVFLEDLCPKLRVRRWRQSLHSYTHKTCIYCGKPSESIDHVLPQSRGGLSITENCVPACLACNGHKSDADAFEWYRRQRFYDPRRAMAIRAWVDGDLRLAMRLLQWANPQLQPQRETQRETPRSTPARSPIPLHGGMFHPQAA